MCLIKEHIRSFFILSGLSCVWVSVCVCLLLFVLRLYNFTKRHSVMNTTLCPSFNFLSHHIPFLSPCFSAPLSLSISTYFAMCWSHIYTCTLAYSIIVCLLACHHVHMWTKVVKMMFCSRCSCASAFAGLWADGDLQMNLFFFFPPHLPSCLSFPPPPTHLGYAVAVLKSNQQRAG